MTFAEISRRDGVQYRCFREAYKAHGLLAHDAEWVLVLTEEFRVLLGSLTHVCDTILTNCKSTSLQNVGNIPRDMFSTSIRIYFRSSRNLLRNDTDTLAYVFST